MKTHEYLEKAAMYDLIGQYYKYTDPNMHIQAYQKHLMYMQKAMVTNRVDMNLRNQPSYVRVLHAVPDAPNVDVYINANRVLKNVAFKDVSEYLTLPAGSYHIDIYPTGNSVTTVISKKIRVETGKVYTLAAVGSGNKLQLLPYLDDPTVPGNETKVRFIHLSPDAPAVDIAVKGGDVVFPNVSFKQATNYLGLTPMTVNLEARAAGTKNSVLTVPNVSLKPNQAYTIVAVGFVDGSPGLETIIING